MVQNFIKISQMIVEILQFINFMADICHLEFSMFSVACPPGNVSMHHCTIFHWNRSNSCRDIAFNVFTASAVCHLGFLIFDIFEQLLRSVSIGQTVAEIWHYFFEFQYGGCSPSWISKNSNFSHQSSWEAQLAST